MKTDIIISGFGGQGVLFAGRLLALAGMQQGQHVTWIPSYGPEMRGGTAHVTVIISDDEIGSPIVRHPSGVLALSNPSLEKYEPLVTAGGVLVYNGSLVGDPMQPKRVDINYVGVPANDIAEEIGHIKTANMVGLGALVAATDVLPMWAITHALRDHLADENPELLALNESALQRGAWFGEPMLI